VILGITPARGGSKGVPRKNIRTVAGRPLLAWTVEAALRSRRLNRYVVSTEDAEIAAVAASLGAEVVNRPAELAADEASTLDVLRHVLDQVPADVVVLLQPTSPVRDEGLIDRCVEEFEARGADSLATGFLCRHTAYGSNDLRRQDMPGIFCDDGNVYVIRADLLRAGDRYGTRRHEVIVDREQNVDIDDEFDLWLADQILRRRSAAR
jgi:CMP-N-acetylneuraminic acid synthetase